MVTLLTLDRAYLASTVVWTVGFKANPLTEQITGERDRQGRLHVDGNLKVKGNDAAAELIGVAPITYSQPKYVTCLDLGAWGAVYTEGWARAVAPPEAKVLKSQINSVWIYPPAADRTAALAAADPSIPVA